MSVWVGVCHNCKDGGVWRKLDDTVRNVVTDERRCGFCNARLQLRCDCKQRKDCSKCGGKGMLPKPKMFGVIE